MANDNDPQETDGSERSVTIVGVGASAGGLAALKTLLAAVPEDSGLAFVVVMHLSPEYRSQLAELLQPHCRMPVQQVNETMPIEANRVYVIPPGANLNTIDTHLRLTELEENRRDRATIDHFFKTLAETHDGEAAAVVLTGTGTDGTLGLRAIKEAGGLTLAQDPDEAEYDSMPRSAIASGVVDLVLPLWGIPAELARFHTSPHPLHIPKESEPLEETQNRLQQKIFAQLRSRVGHDFSEYKRSTMLRRIDRRMQLQQIPSLSQYLERLRNDREEVQALFDDLLITVTEFFRDPPIFERLEREIIPAIFKGKSSKDRVRIWSVGCSTGEEAYSLAMLLMEESARQEEPPELQVFASDLHSGSITRAREGVYPAEIQGNVSPERLRRFFVSENGHNRVRREVRELVVFAEHNLLRDPPFSRVDLIVCRNLMIYLQRDVQQDVINLFHYALRPEGILLLGLSEATEQSDLFRAIDKSTGLYRKNHLPGREPRLPMAQPRRELLTTGGREESSEGHGRKGSLGGLHVRMVERYAPPSILVSEDYSVVHSSARAGRYLLVPSGELTSSIFKLVRDPLAMELRTALHQATETGQEVRSKPVPVQLEGEWERVVLRVNRASEPELKNFFLIIFDEQSDLPPPGEAGEEGSPSATVQELQAELDLNRQRLQSALEEYETSREEMQASNEEMQSINEELRSTMEELETSKEELQSMNEELETLNQENRHRVEELTQLSSDLDNLLSSTAIATLFLDRDLRIVRFTPQVGALFNIRETDKGRRVSDLTHNLGYPDLLDDARQVLARLSTVEREIESNDDHWYLTRVLPYRAVGDVIEGVVLTFIDITERKRAERDLRRNRQLLQTVIDNSPNPVNVMRGSDLRIIMSNQAHETLTWGRSVLGKTLDEIWTELDYDFSALCRRVLESGEMFCSEKECFEIRRTPQGPLEPRWFTFWLVPVDLPGEAEKGLLNTAHEVTESVEQENALREAKAQLEDADRRKDEFLATLAHELRNPLAPIRTGVELLKLMAPGSPEFEEIRATMERQAEQMIVLIDDLMDVSRITRGKVELRKHPVVLHEIVRNAIEATRPLIDEAGHSLTVQQPEETIHLEADPHRLAQVLSNLLSNAARYTPNGGQITIVVRPRDFEAVVEVSDNGRGIPAEKLAQIFEMFAQVDHGSKQGGKGLGIGLTLARSLVEMHGGTIEVESAGPDMGSTFRLRLPRMTRAPADQPERPSAEAPGEAPTQRRVLVVDDHEDAGHTTAVMLSQLGHEVRTAPGGEEGLALAEAFRPDVIFLDLGMPEMDGYEVAAKLREQPWGQAITLIALTGWGQAEDFEKTEAAGFDHHLVKPPKLADIQKLLASTYPLYFLREQS